MVTLSPQMITTAAAYWRTEENHAAVKNLTVNVTSPTTKKPSPTDEQKAVEIAVLSTIFILAVLGNGIVVGFLLFRRKKLSRMNFFIVHLSIADLGVAFFQILSHMIPLILHPRGYKYFNSDILCRLHAYGQLVPLYASSYMLVMIAVDRFFAICKPLSNYSWTKTRSVLMVMFTWFISFLFATPQLVFFYHDEAKGMCYDMFWGVWRTNPIPYRIYVILMMVFSFNIPTVVQMGLYGSIVYAIWTNASLRTATEKSERKGRHRIRSRGKNDNVVAPRTHSTRAVSKAKIKTVVMTFVVILTFILCWMPYWVGMVLWSFFEDFYTSTAADVITLMSALNSCTNPFIYLFFNLQLVLRSMPCGRKSRTRMRMGSESQSMTMSTKMNSSFSFNRGSMSLTALQNANSDGSIPGDNGETKAGVELMAMRRYSPNGLDVDSGCNGDSRDHHVRFGGPNIAGSDPGQANTGYM